MNNATLVVILIVGVVVIANVVATWAAISNDFSESRQKYLQCAFIWFVPGIGAATVIGVLREPKSTGSGKYPVEADFGDEPNVGISNASADYFHDSHHGG